MHFNKLKIIAVILMNKLNGDLFVIDPLNKSYEKHLKLEIKLIDTYTRNNYMKYQEIKYIKEALLFKTDCIALLSASFLDDFSESMKEEFKETSITKILTSFLNSQI